MHLYFVRKKLVLDFKGPPKNWDITKHENLKTSHSDTLKKKGSLVSRLTISKNHGRFCRKSSRKSDRVGVWIITEALLKAFVLWKFVKVPRRQAKPRDQFDPRWKCSNQIIEIKIVCIHKIYIWFCRFTIYLILTIHLEIWNKHKDLDFQKKGFQLPVPITFQLLLPTFGYHLRCPDALTPFGSWTFQAGRIFMASGGFKEMGVANERRLAGLWIPRKDKMQEIYILIISWNVTCNNWLVTCKHREGIYLSW